MKWPYHPYAVDESSICRSGVTYRPEANISVRGDAGEVFLRSLIDTGADHTVLPMSVADKVGAQLLFEEENTAKGVGGHEISIIPGRVQLKLISSDDACEWTAIVAFADFERPEDECSLLGHAGCLEYFFAAFDGVERVVELTLRATLPEHGDAAAS
jgi:hypothetical protein